MRGLQTKRQTLLVVVAVVVLTVAALVFVELYTSPTMTNKLACTDFGYAVYSSQATNGSTITATTTVTTTYTTTATSSGTIGQITTSTKAVVPPPIRLPNGASIISVSSSHSCTYSG
jgi:hypothetical protein